MGRSKKREGERDLQIYKDQIRGKVDVWSDHVLKIRKHKKDSWRYTDYKSLANLEEERNTGVKMLTVAVPIMWNTHYVKYKTSNVTLYKRWNDATLI